MGAGLGPHMWTRLPTSTKAAESLVMVSSGRQIPMPFPTKDLRQLIVANLTASSQRAVKKLKTASAGM